MTRYAADTAVAEDRSLREIERELKRFGATGFGYRWHGRRALVEFEIEHRYVRMTIGMPDLAADEFRFAMPETRQRPRTAKGQMKAHEQAKRAMWRALFLAVKAKLVAVESGIETVEQAFLAHVVMPDGRTIQEHILPQIEQAYLSGDTPQLLPDYSENAA